MSLHDIVRRVTVLPIFLVLWSTTSFSHETEAIVASGAVPDWVDELELGVIPEAVEPQETTNGNVAILNDLQVRYTSEERLHYRHFAYRVLTSEGARANIVRVYFSDPFKAQSATIHRIRQTKSDGRVLDLSIEDCFGGTKKWYHGFKIPYHDVGDLIEIQYTAKYNYEYRLEFLKDILFVSGTNHSRHRLTVSYPEPLAIALSGVPSYLEFRESEVDGFVYKSWSGKLERNVSPNHRNSGNGEFGYRVRVTSIPSWELYSARAYRLATRHYPLPLELIRVAAEIETNHQSEQERLTAVLDYMTNEFYAYGSGQGPQKYDWSLPDLEAVKKFRRCDDFACIAIFVGLLEQLGIDYSYALGGIEGPILGRVGSPASHPINGLEFTLLVLVQTDLEGYLVEFNGFEVRREPLSSADPIYSYLLPLKAAGAVLQEFRRKAPQVPQYRFTRFFDLTDGDDNGFALTETFWVRGDPFFMDEIKNPEKRLEKLGLSYPGVALLADTIETNVSADDETRSTVSFSLPERWSFSPGSSRTEFFVFNDLMSGILSFSKVTGPEPGATQIFYPGFFEAEITIELPEGKNWNLTEFSEEISNPYLKFTLIQRIDGERLTRKYICRVLAARVDEADIAMFYDDLERALDLAGPWSVSYQPN